MRKVVFALLLFVATTSVAMASTRAQREHGAALFDSTGCRHCHTIGNAGGHKGPNLSGVGRTKSSDAIRAQVMNGSKVMPSFGDVLSPAELDDLVAYLRSCKVKPKN